MKNAFIFDMDGTLGETIPLAIKAMQEAYKALNLPMPTENEIVSHFGPTELGLFRKLSPAHGDELFAQYLLSYQKLHAQYAPAPFDGIVSALEKLSAAKIPLAIVTGKSSESALISARHYGIEKYFDKISSGGLFGSVKTERINEILREWNMPPAGVFYVGDSPQDVVEARNAGITPISVAWSEIVDISNLELKKPAFAFAKVSQFNKWLDDFINDS